MLPVSFSPARCRAATWVVSNVVCVACLNVLSSVILMYFHRAVVQ